MQSQESMIVLLAIIILMTVCRSHGSIKCIKMDEFTDNGPEEDDCDTNTCYIASCNGSGGKIDVSRGCSHLENVAVCDDTKIYCHLRAKYNCTICKDPLCNTGPSTTTTTTSTSSSTTIPSMTQTSTTATTSSSSSSTATTTTTTTIPPPPPKPNGILITGGCICSGQDYKPIELIEFYSPEKGRSELLPMKMIQPTRLLHSSVLINDGRILVAGGCLWGVRGAALKSTELLDLRTKQVTQGSPLNLARKEAGMDLLNGKVYICGSWLKGEYSDTVSLDTCEVLNSVDGKWSLLETAMHVQRSDFQLIPLHDSIYAVGGDQESFKNPRRDITIEKYTPLAGEWSMVNGPPKGFGEGLRSDKIDGNIYACKTKYWSSSIGVHDEHSCATYDGTNDKWYTGAVSKRKQEVAGGYVCALDGKLFVMGGWRRDDENKNVESFHPLEGKWVVEPVKLKVERLAASSVVAAYMD